MAQLTIELQKTSLAIAVLIILCSTGIWYCILWPKSARWLHQHWNKHDHLHDSKHGTRSTLDASSTAAVATVQNTTKAEPTPYLTIRISNLPSGVSKQDLASALEGLFSNDHKSGDGENVTVWSLAASTSYHDASRYQIATVTFREIPDILRPCLHKTVSCWVSIEGKRLEISFDTHFLGLTPLNNSGNPTVDIIAVTGLAGHAFGSWKARGGERMWIRDFLEPDLHSDGYCTRIITYGYDSQLVGSDSDASIHEFARGLLEAAKDSRRRPHEIHRPIIFMAHSLGGIVLKHALTEASKGDANDKAIFQSCYAVLFFGVPNRGLHITHLTSLVRGQPNSRLVEDLGEKSQFLPQIFRDFQRNFIFEDAKIYSFYETKDTRSIVNNPDTLKWERIGPKVRMVTRDSATYSGPNEKIYHQFNIDEDHTNMVKFGNRSDFNYQVVRSRITECVQDAPQAIKRRFLDPRQKTSEENECLRSLILTGYDPASKAPQKPPHHGTCEWLLEQNTFQKWRSSDKNGSKLLWIYGNPGTGKTVLMNYLQRYLANDPLSTVVYFFFSDKDRENSTAEAMLRSLCHQLLSRNPGFFQHILPQYDNFQHGRVRRWSADSLWLVFRAIMIDPAAYSIYCVIDALDECFDGPNRNDYCRSDLLRNLHDLYLSQSLSTCAGRIAISSRPLTLIQEVLPNIELDIRLELFIRADIRQYISDEVKRLAQKFKYPADLRSEVEKTLEEKSGNMFLWVSLTVNELGKQNSRAGVQQLLNGVPRTLFAYYEHILATNPSQDVDRVKKLLMWITHSVRPIYLDELAVVMAIRDDTECMSMLGIEESIPLNIEVEIRDSCGPLVEIMDSKVVLVHQTLKDFLTTESEKVGIHDSPPFEPRYHRKYYVPSQEANSFIVRTCLSYLTLADQFGTSHNSELLAYPASFWPIHAGSSAPFDLRTKEVFRKFLDSNSYYFRFWVKCCWNKYFVNEDSAGETFDFIKPLYVASYLHLAPVVQLLLEDGADVNHRGGKYFTALQCAASNGGNIDVVKLLISNGANVNDLGGYYGTAVTSAAFSGNKNIISFLIERGADIHIQEGHFGCALQAAALRGKADIIQLLLKYGADMSIRCGEFGNPLLAAAWAGHLDAMEFFLDQGMHPDTRGRLRGFPLQAAVRRRHIQVIKKLLKRGASINLRGGVHGSALHAAIVEGDATVVKLLIEAGADVNIPSDNHGPALHVAALKGKIRMVQMLVEAGANIDARSSNKTALDVATTTPVIRFLMEKEGKMDDEN